MEEHSTDIEETLINELKRKGIDNNIIPRFIKDMAYSFQIDPSVSLSDLMIACIFLDGKRLNWTIILYSWQ